MAKKTKKTTKVKWPLIEVRQKKDSASGVMTGANTEILIDGKPLKGATKVTFEVEACGVAKMTVEVLGRLAVSGQIGSFFQVPAYVQTE